MFRAALIVAMLAGLSTVPAAAEGGWAKLDLVSDGSTVVRVMFTGAEAGSMAVVAAFRDALWGAHGAIRSPTNIGVATAGVDVVAPVAPFQEGTGIVSVGYPDPGTYEVYVLAVGNIVRWSYQVSGGGSFQEVGRGDTTYFLEPQDFDMESGAVAHVGPAGVSAGRGVKDINVSGSLLALAGQAGLHDQAISITHDGGVEECPCVTDPSAWGPGAYRVTWDGPAVSQARRPIFLGADIN